MTQDLSEKRPICKKFILPLMLEKQANAWIIKLTRHSLSEVNRSQLRNTLIIIDLMFG